MTAGNPDSGLIKLRIGSTPVAIAKLTECSLTINGETRDITTKDSSGWRELTSGLSTWSVKVSGLIDYNSGATANSMLLADAIVAKTTLVAEFGTGVTGDEKMSGSVIVTSFEKSAPSTAQNTTFSCSLEGTGALTIAAYP
jgi:TP901-1 family phage major tail protein